MEGAELIDTTSNAMDRLLQYLDNNLSTLHDNLNEDNFQRVLFVIREIMSETLYQLVNSNLEVLRVMNLIFTFKKNTSCIFGNFTEKEAAIVLFEFTSHSAHSRSILQRWSR